MRAPTTRCAIVHRDATAAYVHSSRNAVRTRPRARSHATSMRMLAIMPAASWVRRSSNNRATSARRSRCDLRTSKPITASSVCACGVSPGRATSSTSPPSCRTSRRSPANSGSRLPTRWQQAPCERQSHQESDGGQKYPPIGRIEGSKKPIETHTPLIRYFINDIGPERRLLPAPTWSRLGGKADAPGSRANDAIDPEPTSLSQYCCTAQRSPLMPTMW